VSEIACHKKAEGFETSFMLKVEITVDAKKSAHRVVEPSVVRRAHVLLYIPGVGIVQHIDYAQPGAELETSPSELEVERILNFYIQAKESPKTPCLVLFSEEVPVLVQF